MNDYRAYVECDYNSIYHYGVPGTHWGDRKGPPYPLNYNWHEYYLKRNLDEQVTDATRLKSLKNRQIIRKK